MATERVPRSLSKLSLSTFRRPSPAPAPAQTQGVAPITVTQDGSYIEVLSLKLSEAVSKALAPSTGPAPPNEVLNGRRPVPAGRGRALGALIASEIKASRENPHLHRAMMRTLHRPLSVLLTNLSGMLVPLLSSSAFLTPPAPTPQAPQPNATQLHAVGIATFAGELLETFDDLGLGAETDMRGDGLKSIREGLASIVKRVIEPLMNGIKNELMPAIQALEHPPVAGGKVLAGIKPVNHPSVASLQAVIPIYARALVRYTTSTAAENTLASLLILLVWRGLVALSHRPAPPPSPPASPALSATGLKSTRELKRSRSASVTIASVTPPATPPPSRFTLKLPPSRPPSPPGVSGAQRNTLAADARALFDLLNLLPRPSADNPRTKLAREAVDEAYEALRALAALLEALQVHPLVVRGRHGSTHSLLAMSASPADLAADLDVLTADLPALVALPVLLRAFVPTHAPADGAERSVAGMVGLPEADYRKGCLGGFGRAEECTAAVGARVLDVLRAENSGGADAIVRWLEHRVAEAEADAGH
ncbi:hypothetical protein CERSUDRAFT_83328 [Gelatoporia subvermispora B]|uniref:Uncharacterized protein n=1 Tax=Ceriporiopsis subvermispora (strain B) TaxID=914234 RepID=M2PMG7_CERS8|nr:hypothetical protein CERSUDRAFT_83328 [Gelatoporia subvermispora B]